MSWFSQSAVARGLAGSPLSLSLKSCNAVNDPKFVPRCVDISGLEVLISYCWYFLPGDAQFCATGREGKSKGSKSQWMQQTFAGMTCIAWACLGSTPCFEPYQKTLILCWLGLIVSQKSPRSLWAAFLLSISSLPTPGKPRSHAAPVPHNNVLWPEFEISCSVFSPHFPTPFKYTFLVQEELQDLPVSVQPLGERKMLIWCWMHYGEVTIPGDEEGTPLVPPTIKNTSRMEMQWSDPILAVLQLLYGTAETSATKHAGATWCFPCPVDELRF